MKKLMTLLFLSCSKATELMEKKRFFNLSFSEKIQLKMHKMMCHACTRYEKHSILIDKCINNTQKQDPKSTDLEKLKNRIFRNLKEK